MFEPDNECQSDGAQHSQWCHTTAQVRIYKILHISAHFKIRDLENVGQGRDVQYLQWHHSMANTRLSTWWQW